MNVKLCLLILFLLIYPNSSHKSPKKNFTDPKSCFCKLTGEVDDCACKVESLDYLNNEKIYPLLQSLLQRDYFRFFKVNLHKPCPFWSDDSRCAIKDCHVTSCQENEVPTGLKDKSAFAKYTKEAQVNSESCNEERELSALDHTMSDERKEAFKNWTHYDDSLENFCELDDEHSNESQYVDLLLNPERYTGYKGASPHRIWRSIYEENCFKPENTFKYGVQQSLASEMCLEKRAFYRLVSGLHTSINIHLCAQYLLPAKTAFEKPEWGPNLKEFTKRFNPNDSKGAGPQFLKNLYFTYLVELRALAKAAPYFKQEDFYTGNEEEDRDVQKGIEILLSHIKSFKYHFDERKLFQGNSQEVLKLRNEFRNHFHNISKIMDCVGCDKCRLWGKLQVQGMGTALKILFSGDTQGPESTVDAQEKNKFQLRRSEIVSLFNAFARLSSSIRHIEMFKKMTLQMDQGGA